MYTVYADEISEVDNLAEAKEICWFAGQGHVEDDNGNVVYEYRKDDAPDYVLGIIADED